MQSLNFAPGVFEEDCGTKKFFFCTSPGCETNPIFGLEWGVPLRCSLHKRSGDALVYKVYSKDYSEVSSEVYSEETF